MFSRDHDLRAGCLMQQGIVQVIAPLLIIQRVANQSALTSHIITTAHASSFNFKRQEDGYLKNSAAEYGKDPSELGVVV